MNYGSGWWPIFNHVKEADLRKWAGHQRGSERELEKETLGSIQVLCSINLEGQLHPSLSLLFQRFTFFATASWSPNCSAKSEGSSRASKRAVSKGEVRRLQLSWINRSEAGSGGRWHSLIRRGSEQLNSNWLELLQGAFSGLLLVVVVCFFFIFHFVLFCHLRFIWASRVTQW